MIPRSLFPNWPAHPPFQPECGKRLWSPPPPRALPASDPGLRSGGGGAAYRRATGGPNLVVVVRLETDPTFGLVGDARFLPRTEEALWVGAVARGSPSVRSLSPESGPSRVAADAFRLPQAAPAPAPRTQASVSVALLPAALGTGPCRSSGTSWWSSGCRRSGRNIRSRPLVDRRSMPPRASARGKGRRQGPAAYTGRRRPAQSTPSVAHRARGGEGRREVAAHAGRAGPPRRRPRPLLSPEPPRPPCAGASVPPSRGGRKEGGAIIEHRPQDTPFPSLRLRITKR